MANLKVNGVVDKMAKTGRPFKALEVQDESGAVFKVNVFSNAPDFANIKAGSVLNGVLVQDGNFWNITFAEQEKRPSGAYRPPQQAIKENMDIKRQDIARSQENKENSIKIASTIRMATDIATSLTPEQWHSTTMQEEIRFWREWLWLEWDNTGSNTMPPF